MIDTENAERIHRVLIDKFGGEKGIREGALESALNRPYSTFDRKELYPASVDKAAAIIESLIKNHPFMDGNKRIGYVLMRLTLMQSGHDIVAEQNDKYNFVIRIAKGELEFKQIRSWISKRLI
ncbi:MAG: type II toxin-antitoxin system death-on-curing family toxin [Bacteroidota bacterium]